MGKKNYWEELEAYKKKFLSLQKEMKEKLKLHQRENVISMMKSLNWLIDKVQELELHFVFPTSYPLSMEIFEARENILNRLKKLGE